ncbi:TetR/AcrR family transcriptional regulator [Cellulomonas sp. HZM]|uniref:TetR/AcrR family transcriptional regulator n=1 Tax=Cellulomonas sp. HZM TaxID=1454010 RepID=UPI000493234E|nr:TetR/AcrR family transcriptional regulator [Cellulomonas sp. HZM]
MSTRSGRRPGGQPTRQEIVEAARATFAAQGFDGSTIRGIAAAASVDPALVHHYFGTKEELLLETLQFPDGGEHLVLSSLDGDVSDVGERLTRAYLSLWESDDTRSQMVILARSALTNEAAMARVRPLIAAVQAHLRSTTPAAARADDTFALAIGQLLGIACGRHITRIPTLCALTFDELVERVAPSVQVLFERPADGP